MNTKTALIVIGIIVAAIIIYFIAKPKNAMTPADTNTVPVTQTDGTPMPNGTQTTTTTTTTVPPNPSFPTTGFDPNEK